jgi:hypothetical protein
MRIFSPLGWLVQICASRATHYGINTSGMHSDFFIFPN